MRHAACILMVCNLLLFVAGTPNLILKFCITIIPEESLAIDLGRISFLFLCPGLTSAAKRKDSGGKLRGDTYMTSTKYSGFLTKLVNFYRLTGKFTGKTFLPIYRYTIFTDG